MKSVVGGVNQNVIVLGNGAVGGLGKRVDCERIAVGIVVVGEDRYTLTCESSLTIAMSLLATGGSSSTTSLTVTETFAESDQAPVGDGVAKGVDSEETIGGSVGDCPVAVVHDGAVGGLDDGVRRSDESPSTSVSLEITLIRTAVSSFVTEAVVSEATGLSLTASTVIETVAVVSVSVAIINCVIE